MFQEPCGSFIHMPCSHPTLTQRGSPQKWDFGCVRGHALLNHFWKESLPWLVYSDAWIGRLKWSLFPCNHWVYGLGHRAPSDILRVLLPLAAWQVKNRIMDWRGSISITSRRCDLEIKKFRLARTQFPQWKNGVVNCEWASRSCMPSLIQAMYNKNSLNLSSQCSWHQQCQWEPWWSYLEV